MTKEKQNKIIVFLDTLGRTIIGKEGDSTTDKLEVINPAVLNIIPTQQGTMQVQIIPLIFRELLADKEADVAWTYRKSLITECSKDTLLNTTILSQYQNVISPVPQAAPETQNESKPSSKPETIKLFDQD